MKVDFLCAGLTCWNKTEKETANSQTEFNLSISPYFKSLTSYLKTIKWHKLKIVVYFKIWYIQHCLLFQMTFLQGLFIVQSKNVQDKPVLLRFCNVFFFKIFRFLDKLVLTSFQRIKKSFKLCILVVDKATSLVYRKTSFVCWYCVYRLLYR